MSALGLLDTVFLPSIFGTLGESQTSYTAAQLHSFLLQAGESMPEQSLGSPSTLLGTYCWHTKCCLFVALAVEKSQAWRKLWLRDEHFVVLLGFFRALWTDSWCAALAEGCTLNRRTLSLLVDVSTNPLSQRVNSVLLTCPKTERGPGSNPDLPDERKSRPRYHRAHLRSYPGRGQGLSSSPGSPIAGTARLLVLHSRVLDHSCWMSPKQIGSGVGSNEYASFLPLVL